MDDISKIQAYVPAVSLGEILPFLILLIGAILCLLVDAITDKNASRRSLPVIAGATLIVAIGSLFMNMMPTGTFVEDSFYSDDFGRMAAVVILFASFAQTIFGPRLVQQRNLPSGEFYTLVLFAALGMTLLTMSNELLTAFISLEILSLSLYVLTGIDRRSGKAAEASFKYLLLGAFASAFLVFGIAFLYGATGTTRITEMIDVFQSGHVGNMRINEIWVYIGFALMLVGISFKLSLAPFHMWAPDVYEGANTPTTMVIATGSKVAAMAFLFHLVGGLSTWQPFQQASIFVVGFVAVASMIWGNLAALVQTDFKRMMAYSSVSHTGYMMVGILVLIALPGTLSGEMLESAKEATRQAIILYLAGYTVMSVLGFGIAFQIGGEGDMAAYRGLVFRNPLAALGMAIAMFSLVGIGFTPPTIGFMGKFYLFKEAVQHDFTAIVVVAVLASVVSAFYYLGLVVTMFMRESEDEDTVLAGTGAGATTLITDRVVARAILVVSALLIFLFGIFPSIFLNISSLLVTR